MRYCDSAPLVRDHGHVAATMLIIDLRTRKIFHLIFAVSNNFVGVDKSFRVHSWKKKNQFEYANETRCVTA